MKNACALVVTGLTLYVGVRYSFLAWRGDIQPVIAAWVMLCTAITLSMLTYRSTQQRSWIENIGNTVDVVASWMILLSIFLLGKNVHLGLNGVDLVCLGLSAIILLFWRVSKRHTASNLALQAVLTIAYFPTIYALWSSGENTESLAVWSVIWTASLFAVWNGVMSRNRLAIIYASRSLLIISVVVALILRNSHP